MRWWSTFLLSLTTTSVCLRLINFRCPTPLRFISIVKLERLRLNFPHLSSLFWHFSIPLQALPRPPVMAERKKLLHSITHARVHDFDVLWLGWDVFAIYVSYHSLARRSPSPLYHARRAVKGSWLVSRNVKNRSFERKEEEKSFSSSQPSSSSFMFGKLIEGCSFREDILVVYLIFQRWCVFCLRTLKYWTCGN